MPGDGEAPCAPVTVPAVGRAVAPVDRRREVARRVRRVGVGEGRHRAAEGLARGGGEASTPCGVSTSPSATVAVPVGVQRCRCPPCR